MTRRVFGGVLLMLTSAASIGLLVAGMFLILVTGEIRAAGPKIVTQPLGIQFEIFLRKISASTNTSPTVSYKEDPIQPDGYFFSRCTDVYDKARSIDRFAITSACVMGFVLLMSIISVLIAARFAWAPIFMGGVLGSAAALVLIAMSVNDAWYIYQNYDNCITNLEGFIPAITIPPGLLERGFAPLAVTDSDGSGPLQWGRGGDIPLPAGDFVTAAAIPLVHDEGADKVKDAKAVSSSSPQQQKRVDDDVNTNRNKAVGIPFDEARFRQRGRRGRAPVEEASSPLPPPPAAVAQQLELRRAVFKQQAPSREDIANAGASPESLAALADLLVPDVRSWYLGLSDNDKKDFLAEFLTGIVGDITVKDFVIGNGAWTLVGGLIAIGVSFLLSFVLFIAYCCCCNNGEK